MRETGRETERHTSTHTEDCRRERSGETRDGARKRDKDDRELCMDTPRLH